MSEDLRQIVNDMVSISSLKSDENFIGSVSQSNSKARNSLLPKPNICPKPTGLKISNRMKYQEKLVSDENNVMSRSHPSPISCSDLIKTPVVDSRKLSVEKVKSTSPSNISSQHDLSSSSSSFSCSSSASATALTTSSILKSTFKRVSTLLPSSNNDNCKTDQPAKLITAVKNSKTVQRELPQRKTSSNLVPERTKSSLGFSSSLNRRPMQKSNALRPPSDEGKCNSLQRSGTSGALIKRSQSIAGARVRRARERDLYVQKSRPTQTLLTRDVVRDEDDINDGQDDSTHIVVSFDRHLPLIISAGDEEVETHVTEHMESVDVRKNRQLTLENMRLHREVDRLKSAAAADGEAVRRELKLTRGRLETSNCNLLNAQRELEGYHNKARKLLQSMDLVEHQIISYRHNSEELQSRLDENKIETDRIRGDLSSAEKVIQEQSKDLAKYSMKLFSLNKQTNESETEALELQEFLQAEKNTLTEALRDTEKEIGKLTEALKRKGSKLHDLEDRCVELMKFEEQGKLEISRLEELIQGLQFKIECMTLSKSKLMLEAQEIISDILYSIKNTTSTIAKTSNGNSGTHESNGRKDDVLQASSLNLFDMDDNVEESEHLLINSLVELRKLIANKSLYHPIPTWGDEKHALNQDEINNEKIPATVEATKDILEENANLKARFLRHRTILEANNEKSESEIKKLDKMYLDIVNNVLNSLLNVPTSVIQEYSPLKHLLANIQEESSDLQNKHTNSLMKSLSSAV